MFYQKTLFGWVASGCCDPTIEKHTSNPAVCNQVLTTGDTVEINNKLREFWELENIHVRKTAFTPEERQYVEHFNNTTKRLSSGRFCVSFPWKLPPYN